MENTLENKAKFFAQYFGQSVLMFNQLPLLSKHFISEDFEKYWIVLKPLSSITDEDLNNIHKILRLGSTEAGFDTSIDKIKECLSDSIHDIFLVDFYGHSFESFDYLRSKGYALDWMGLSVEDLINYSWVKLS